MLKTDELAELFAKPQPHRHASLGLELDIEPNFIENDNPSDVFH
jgi:hypothetical protein